MLKDVKKINFKLEDNKVFSEYQNEISEYWKEFSKEKNDVFDGDVIAVSNIEENDLSYDITINLIKYSELIFSKKINIGLKALFSGGYIITSDNYVCFALNKNNKINLVGGMASIDDILNNKYNPNLCMIREFKEEIGLNLNSDKFKYNIKYIKNSNENEKNNSIGLIYKINTNYTKDELNNLFINNNHDDELKELIFLRKNELSRLDSYDKVVYINELYSLIEGELK